MATRAMYLSVKMDADTKYYSLLQTVYDYLAINNASVIVIHNGGQPTTAGATTLKTWIDDFFTNKRGSTITTKGETISTYAAATTTSETITAATIGGTNIAMSAYFTPNIAAVYTYISPYVRFKIASMIDADYAAFVDKLRTNVKAAYPVDRIWNETNTPEA